MADEQTIQIPKLDEAGKIPVTYLPDSVGDVITAIENAETVNDPILAGLIGDSASQTGVALSAAIAEAVAEEMAAYSMPPLGYGQDEGATLVATRLANKSGDVTVVGLGDSTGNDNPEWLRASIVGLGARDSDLHVRDKLFDTTTQDYGDWRTVQAGAGSGGLISDDFEGRTGELSGSGPGWTGATGVWSVTSGYAAPGTTGTAYLASTASDDFTARFLGVQVDSTAGASTKTARLYSKYVSGSNHLFVTITVSTTGVVAASLFKVIEGASVSLGSFTGLDGTLVDDGWSTFDVVIGVAGDTVTATVNGIAVNATLDPADMTALEPATQVAMGITSANTAGAFRVGGVQVETPSTARTLSLYNGSVAGSTLQYQIDRMATFLPERPDVVILNSGHNYGNGTATDYLTEVEDAAAAIHAIWAGVPIIVSSQNPEFAPRAQSMIDAHLRRNTELRIRARRNQWGYVPGMEAFAAQPDGGASLVTPDGIHPVSAGSALWRDTFLAYLDAQLV